MTDKEMIYSIGLWFAKFMNDYNSDTFTQELTNVTDKDGKQLGSFVLTVERIHERVALDTRPRKE